MILRTAMVTEADFPALKALCEKGAIGNSYKDFLRILDRDRAHARLLEVEVQTVRIDPREFASWLGNRPARRGDLLSYAYAIYKKQNGP